MTIRNYALISVLIFASCYTSIVQGQGKEVFAKWNSPSVLVLDYFREQTLVNVPIDSNGNITLSKLPEKLTIILPAQNPEKTRIKLNTGKEETFYIGFESEKGTKNLNLQWADISNNAVELFFHKGELVQIGSRRLSEPKAITSPLKIQVIIFKPVTDPKPVAPTPKEFPDTNQKPLPVDNVSDADIKELAKCIMCTVILECCDTPNSKALKKDSQSVRPSKWKRYFSPRKYAETYQAYYRDSGQWVGYIQGHGYYLIDNTASIHPIPGSILRVKIVAHDTSKIAISADGESFFLEKSKEFIGGLSPQSEEKPVTENTALHDPDSTINKDGSAERDAKLQQARLWKTRLIALDYVLEKFNAQFSENRFLPSEKRAELLKIELGIKSCLHLTLNNADPSSLKREIIRAISLQVDSAYWKALEGSVNNAGAEYEKAVNKKTNLALFIKEVQIPDDDQVTIKITNLDNTKTIVPAMVFNTRGGFKIDFSSGVFFSNLKNPDFILTKSVFKYRETRDTVVTLPGGIPKDSIMYTGNIATTSGNFIRENESKLNYGAGIFFHGYRRTGNAFNCGIAAGALLNSTGEVYAALGLSLMLKSKFGRIALVGGLIGGQEKQLSVSGNDFLYKTEYEAFENGKTIFENSRQVPRFFESDSNEIPEHKVWRIGYFVGLTFNISTINL